MRPLPTARRVCFRAIYRLLRLNFKAGRGRNELEDTLGGIHHSDCFYGQVDHNGNSGSFRKALERERVDCAQRWALPDSAAFKPPGLMRVSSGARGLPRSLTATFLKFPALLNSAYSTLSTPRLKPSVLHRSQSTWASV